MKENRQIIILGGFGVTGQLIADCLCALGINADSITLSSRNPEKKNLFHKDLKTVRVDIENKLESVATIKGYDLAILAIGPFEKYGLLPYEVCLEAGVDVVDVNDDYVITQKIYTLHERAEKKSCSIFTGMGLSPGLTTFQLLFLLNEQSNSLKKEVFFKLFVGAKQLAGKASVEVMFEGFNKKDIPCIIEGEVKNINVEKEIELDKFDFQNGHCEQELFLCPTPHVYTFSQRELLKKYEIKKMIFALTFESIKRKTINFLRNTKWIHNPIVKKVLIKLIYLMQKRTWANQKYTKESISIVEVKANDLAKKSKCSGLSSYEMTARFAGIMAAEILENGERKKGGVFSFEDIEWLDYQIFKLKLERNGFVF